jgi:catechol 2,3-dioxygenase-like lactoylglutathione lyase family enzyme
MHGDIDIIHHPGLVAEDIEAAVAQYERLGFVFTPLSLAKISLDPGAEPVYLGAGNRNAIFERNFLEIVGVTDADVWANFPVAKRGPFNLDERLGLYQGLHIMHFGADDVTRVRARLQAAGVEVSDIATLQRTVETPEGPRVMEAKTVYFAPGANPEALMQIAQHVTPQYALQQRYNTHPNGARRLTEVIVCSDDPQRLAAKYARYSGRPVQERPHYRFLDLGHTRVLVSDPGSLSALSPGQQAPVVPFLAGITVAASSLDAARDVLRGAGVPFSEVDGRLVVSPEHGCGSAVLFETLDATR